MYFKFNKFFFINEECKLLELSSELLSSLKINSNSFGFWNFSINNRLYLMSHSDGNYYISRSIALFRRAFDLDLVTSEECESFYIKFGFIYPPYTLYKNIFLMAPYVRFNNHGDQELAFEPIINPYEKKGITNYLENPIELKGDILRELNKELKRTSSEPIYSDILFSGGIDSSALLGILDEAGILGSAITCNMPTLSSEISKSELMADQLSVKQRIIDIPIDLEIESANFINSTSEPIQDSIAPVLAYCFNFLGNQERNKSYVIVDGQGADSLFAGLPHDKVYTLYKKLSNFKFLKSLLRVLPSYFPRHISRTLYRLFKAVDALSQDSISSSIEVTLIEDHSVALDSNNPVLKYMRREFNDLSNNYEDYHVGIRYIFLFRILPAREMQKYMNLPKNVKVILPFLSDEIVERFFNESTDNLIKQGVYKYPMYRLAKSYFPRFIQSSATSPFAIFYKAGGKDIKDFSISEINRLS